MEQNDWTRQLHDRLENHKTAVPSDLWDNIERQLDAKSKSRKPRLVLRVAYWVSAAAAVALLIVGAFYTNHDALAPVSAPLAGVRQGAEAESKTHGSENKTPCAGTETALQAETASAGTLVAIAGNPASVASVPDETPLDAALQQNAAESSENSVADATSQDGGTPHSARKESIEKREGKRNAVSDAVSSAAAYGHRSEYNGTSRWSVGAHTGNAFAESRSTTGATPVAGMYAASGKMDDNVLFCSYPSIFAGYKEVKHHNQPFTAGVSVSYSINSRIALTTGLVYTRVTSDFIQSAGSDEIADNQRLHYIGIPLGVNYSLWSNRHVRTYATAGAQVDFNVKATLASDGITSDIDKDRPQVSGTVAAGIEYNIVPQLGLYAEPGVRYYFNNHSGVDNIFKDKPWAFSLQIGLRLNVK